MTVFILNWDATDISTSDPRTSETKLQVQKIINLQHIANNMPDAFADYKGVTKSYNPMRNVPETVEVPNKTTQFPSKRGEVRLFPRMQLLASKGKGRTKFPTQQMQVNLMLRDTLWRFDLHIPHLQCTQLLMLGHHNT